MTKLPWMNTEQYYSFWMENGGSTKDFYHKMMEFATDYTDYCDDRDGYKEKVHALEKEIDKLKAENTFLRGASIKPDALDIITKLTLENERLKDKLAYINKQVCSQCAWDIDWDLDD